MDNEELETLGYYEPGFLHLRINTDHDISDLNELASNEDTKRYFSTFLHEYIHFLQSVTSTSGLMSAGFYIDYIKEVNWEIRHDGKSEFEVPFKVSNKFNVEANMDLQEIYRGERNGSAYVKYDSYLVESVLIIDKDGNEKKPKKYRVYYYDLKTGGERSFYFGHACLKEYVAHTIQKEHSPAIEHPDIPYQIAEQIIKKEYSAFGTNPMHLVALCDSCLMCMHPAEMFFNTIDRMKNVGFIPNATKDIYEFAYNDIMFQGQDGKYSIESLFRKMIHYADSQYLSALQSDIFALNYNWIKHILQQAMILRLEHSDFMTKLVMKDGKLSDVFFEIIRKLGTPYFTNNKDQGKLIPPNGFAPLPDQPYQLLVFKQIINIFNGYTQCSLYGFCKSRRDKDITNEHCKTAPWNRATEEDLCPLGQLWKTWGLIGEVPVKKS